MKKHLPVIILVLLILGAFGWYGQSHKSSTQKAASPTASSNSSTPTPTISTPSPPTFNKQKYSIDDPTSIWVVVNKKRPLNPLSYAPSDLVSVGNGQSMRTEAAQAFTKIQADAKTAGYSLVAESGYRSYTTQTSVYKNEVKAFGQTKADSESARPGHSEHQTGWAVDIGAPGCYEDCFGTMQASKWVLDNAYKYGFVLRYPTDKSDITGYRNEPWHFRYIGVDLATEMHNQNVTTLEEFFGLPAAPSY